MITYVRIPSHTESRQLQFSFTVSCRGVCMWKKESQVATLLGVTNVSQPSLSLFSSAQASPESNEPIRQVTISKAACLPESS